MTLYRFLLILIALEAMGILVMHIMHPEFRVAAVIAECAALFCLILIYVCRKHLGESDGIRRSPTSNRLADQGRKAG